jgi:hypothetical protein
MAQESQYPFSLGVSARMNKELGDNEASFYQSQIGVLHWMVEIGRIDIITEVSMLASCVAAPRAGHLETNLSYVFLFGKEA